MYEGNFTLLFLFPIVAIALVLRLVLADILAKCDDRIVLIVGQLLVLKWVLPRYHSDSLFAVLNLLAVFTLDKLRQLGVVLRHVSPALHEAVLGCRGQLRAEIFAIELDVDVVGLVELDLGWPHVDILGVHLGRLFLEHSVQLYQR